jgi:hypothetical protein
MLDRIPAEARHIFIMLLAAVLGWASDNVLNLGLPPLVASLAGVVVGTLILWVTPMTRQYGIGKDTNDDLS